MGRSHSDGSEYGGIGGWFDDTAQSSEDVTTAVDEQELPKEPPSIDSPRDIIDWARDYDQNNGRIVNSMPSEVPSLSSVPSLNQTEDTRSSTTKSSNEAAEASDIAETVAHMDLYSDSSSVASRLNFSRFGSPTSTDVTSPGFDRDVDMDQDDHPESIYSDSGSSIPRSYSPEPIALLEVVDETPEFQQSNNGDNDTKPKHDGQTSPSHMNNGSSTSTKEPHQSGLPKRSRHESDNDDNGPQESSKSKRPKKQDDVGQRLACPFYKFDSHHYRRCHGYDLKKNSIVKQHLFRSHLQPKHCDRCLEVFDNEDALREHRRAQQCEVREYIAPPGITPEQERRLRPRGSQNKSESEQWFEMYEILFPHAKKPKSAYLNGELSEDVESLQEFLERCGPAMVVEKLKESNVVAQDVDNQVLQEQIQNAFSNAFDGWQNERKETNKENGSGRSKTPKTPKLSAIDNQGCRRTDTASSITSDFGNKMNVGACKLEQSFDKSTHLNYIKATRALSPPCSSTHATISGDMDSSPNAKNQKCPVETTTREGDSAELQPETTSSRGAFCDGCDKDIYVTRHKCQDCPDFDYCSDCVVQASTTHPLHSFTSLDFHAPPEDLDNKQDNPTVLDKDSTNNKGAVGYKAVVPWPLRLSRLIAASQLGCSFCTLVLDRIFGPDNVTWFGYQPTKTWRAHPTKPDVQRNNLLQRVMRFLTALKSDWFRVDVYPSYDPTPPNLTRLEIGLSPGTAEYQDPEELKRVFSRHGEIKFEVDVFASSDDPASEHLRMRPPNPSPGTETSFLKVKQWMDHCDSNHEACRSSSRPTALPNRVLDVTLEGDLVRLHPATPGQLGRYTALSYCWGGPQICETTKANVSGRLNGFSASELSSSLQDAIRITRALGIPYLWIDAICIIQDDKVDKATQIGQMGAIYRNSTLTICASRSQQAEKGFLQDWSDPDTGLWPTLIPLTYNLPSDLAKTADEAFDLPHKATGTVWIQDEDSYLTRKFNDHLSRRAWCLQERVLSPRVLEYSRWPCWRCNVGTMSDGGFYLLDERSGPEERQLTRILCDQRESKVDLFTLNQLYGAWYKLLNEYTKRNISVPSDRLPAIGGIASRISHITGVKYVAGLWENNLLHDLMWKCSPGEWKHRPETWRAPSWSWASIEGPVSLTCIPDDSMPLASVIDCYATPIFNVKLPLDVLDVWRKQELAPAPPADNDVAKWQAALWEFMTNDFTGQGKVEDDLDSLAEKIFGLVTFSRESSEVDEEMSKSPSWSGLLLRQVPDGKYERIGLFLQEDYDWLDQVKKPWPTETIEVV
ncbi:hypothetical protein NM208_g1991 [Fusarium decemcellulare]|uniref:Uncharacterized protein n=1 Tax=Fusarium decemcellulare TaxID=57161 RepID=A0ACC1SUC8_9HYPO|nr:hypothetical protein NM208_g1991 [Fusarium decemcellulare]